MGERLNGILRIAGLAAIFALSPSAAEAQGPGNKVYGNSGNAPAIQSEGRYPTNLGYCEKGDSLPAQSPESGTRVRIEEWSPDEVARLVETNITIGDDKEFRIWLSAYSGALAQPTKNSSFDIGEGKEVPNLLYTSMAELVNPGDKPFPVASWALGAREVTGANGEKEVLVFAATTYSSSEGDPLRCFRTRDGMIYLDVGPAKDYGYQPQGIPNP